MNNLTSIDLLGLIAGTFTTIAFLPQLIKTWNSKSAEDISLGMFLLFSLGVALWGVYGFEIHSIPVIIANLVTFLLTLSILGLKIYYLVVSD